MRANLDLTHGALFSQRVLLALVEQGRSRDEAYRIVQEDAQRAWDTGVQLRDLLAAARPRARPRRDLRPRPLHALRRAHRRAPRRDPGRWRPPRPDANSPGRAARGRARPRSRACRDCETPCRGEPRRTAGRAPRRALDAPPRPAGAVGRRAARRRRAHRGARARPRRGPAPPRRRTRPGSSSRSSSSSSRASPTWRCSGRCSAASTSWRTSWEIGWSELAVGSLVPASGAGGLALGAWILSQGGMPAEQDRPPVGRVLPHQELGELRRGRRHRHGRWRSGVGPHRSLLLTALPAALSVAVDRRGPAAAADRPGPGGRRRRRPRRARPSSPSAARSSTAPARRSGSSAPATSLVIAGAFGYWAFDNAVLWAMFRAFDTTVAADGDPHGLPDRPARRPAADPGRHRRHRRRPDRHAIVYGAPAAATAAAVLAYRVILFWLPLLVGGVAFARAARPQPSRPARPLPPA